MEMKPLELKPVSVPEWDAEDELSGVLSVEALDRANEEESRRMLEKLRLELPRTERLEQVKLLDYARQRKTPMRLDIPPDSVHYDFYLIELPLTILVVEQRLTRLRLALKLQPAGMQDGDSPVAYDLFPDDRTDIKTVMSGEASLDVSKALKYILTAAGAGAAAPLVECFGLRLTLPFQWKSRYTRVRTSDRMSNPVEWYVTDSRIQDGFTAHVIIRAPKGAPVRVAADLVCEVRRSGLLGKILKSHYRSDTRTYVVGP